MRRALFAFLLSFSVAANAANWTSGGPLGAKTFDLAFAASNRSIVYAATVAGIFRSSDGGATWAKVHPALKGDIRLVVDSTKADVVLVAAQDGLIRTFDGGRTWEKAGSGIQPPIYVIGLVADPRDPNVIYFGGNCDMWAHPDNTFVSSTGVFKSTNGGRSFHPSRRPLGSDYYGCPQSLTLDPAAPDRIHLGLYARSVVTSSDGGATWQGTSDPAPTRAIVKSPDGRHYGVGPNGLAASDDEGRTWKEVHVSRGIDALGVEEAKALDVDPTRGRLFLGGPRGAFRSGDGGISWAPLTGPARDPMHVLDFHPSADPTIGTVTIATGYGVFTSRAFHWGDWTQLPAYERSSLMIDGFAADPKNGDVYARSGRRVFRTRDRGKTWEMAGDPLPDSSSLTALAVDAGHTLYATIPHRGLFRLRQGETEWKLIREFYYPSTPNIRVTPHPNDPGTIYLGLSKLYASVDSGDTWQELSSQPFGIWEVRVIESPRSGLVIWAFGQGVRKSLDGGRTWSADKAPQFGYVWWFLVSPADPNVLYLHTNSTELARSNDGGETWTAITPNERLWDAPVIDPLDPDALYGTAALTRVLRSTDGGKNWVRIDDGLPFESGLIHFGGTNYVPFRRQILIDPMGMTLYATTSASGAWQLAVRSGRRRSVH